MVSRLWGSGKGSQRGLTLIELSIVLALIVILASMVAITVTGSGTTARATTKATDSREVQKAVNVYQAMHPKAKWPTSGKQVGSQAIPTGGLPAIVFDPADPASFAAIDWHATFTTTLEGARSLVPDLLPRIPKHGLDTTLDANGDGQPDQPVETLVWVVGSDGVVHVLLADAGY